MLDARTPATSLLLVVHSPVNKEIQIKPDKKGNEILFLEALMKEPYDLAPNKQDKIHLYQFHIFQREANYLSKLMVCLTEP